MEKTLRSPAGDRGPQIANPAIPSGTPRTLRRICDLCSLWLDQGPFAALLGAWGTGAPSSAFAAGTETLWARTSGLFVTRRLLAARGLVRSRGALGVITWTQTAVNELEKRRGPLDRLHGPIGVAGEFKGLGQSWVVVLTTPPRPMRCTGVAFCQEAIRLGCGELDHSQGNQSPFRFSGYRFL